MNRLILPIIVLIFTGCASPHKPSYPVSELPSASAMYPSPDGRLYVTIRHTKAPFTVAIIERESGRVLGAARSSAHLNQEGDKLQGEVRVTYADDLSAIVVHEEFSDASPNPRYILFLRDKSGSVYRELVKTILCVKQAVTVRKTNVAQETIYPERVAVDHVAHC